MHFTVETLWQNVRYAWRRLVTAPMFLCVAVIVLALGVGVNTAFFSVVNGVLLRNLSVPNIDQLVNIAASRHGDVDINMGLNERRLDRLRERKPMLIEDLLTVHNFQVAVESDGPAALLMGEAVSGDYFTALGLRPLAGRLLVAADDTAGAGGPVVVSARFWRRQFGADPDAIGRTVRASGLPLTIVGVAPDSFTGLTAPNILAADLWVPQNSVRPLLETSNTRSGLTFRMFARLKSGATLTRADAEMRTLGVGIDPNDADVGLALVRARKGLLPTQLATLQSMLGFILLALSSLVLFVACANLSGLVLARASRRATEIAVRLAIGADRRRILQMQMVETALLSTIAGFVGFGVAWSLTRAAGLLPIPEIGGMVVRINAAPDLRVFVFALFATAVTSMLVGSMPAARMADTDPLRAWSASGSGGVTPRLRASTSRLVAFQFGASLSLLLIASLFVRSATAATTYDAGVAMDRIAAGRVNLRIQKIKDADGPAVFDRLLSGAMVPGTRASLASGVPIGGDGRREGLRVYGRAATYVTHALVVSPSFFQMFDLQIERGRAFTDADAPPEPSVAVVNEVVADDLWPGQNAIGQSFRVSTMENSPTVTVVGVVKATDHSVRDGLDRRYIFLPLRQHYTPQMTLLVSGSGDASALATRLRALVASAAPELAVFDVKPLTAFIGLGATGAAAAAITIGATGLLGFFIATVGLYGTVAYVVGERTREFGIMRALGAGASHIRRMVLRDAIRMLLWGMAPGFVVTFLSAGLLQSWLLGLPAHDPLTFAVVPLVMFLGGCLAALIPAHRAANVDPTNAIRHL